MLSAIRLLSVNPWVVVAVLVTAAAAAVSVFFYGVNVGGLSAKLACEKRVASVMKQIDEKNREIDRINEAWARAIELVQENYNASLAKEAAYNDALEKRIADFETSIKPGDPCTITDADLSSVRSDAR
jgi:hypothetical protein